MNRLFDIDELKTNSNYISPQEKKKWNEAFKKFILDEYNENNGKYYDGHCGSRKYCDLCEMKYCNGNSDCLVAMKKYCKRHNIYIDYRDYDFEKFLDNFR